MSESEKRSRMAARILVWTTLTIFALVAAMGFTWYRSETGPSPAFAIEHPPNIQIQEAWLNGAWSYSYDDTESLTTISRNIRPGDAVALELVTRDGRSFELQLTEMGHQTQTIQLAADQLTRGDFGVLEIVFDESPADPKVTYRGGSSRVRDNTFRRALRIGEQEIEVQFESDTGVQNAKRTITIHADQQNRYTLQEFLDVEQVLR